ncbi:MAG: ring-cleaving dioxygenase, partial [Bacteroidota bacterium]|nr:ring-cleaving dioxygenase [Bacteroidota bacterium]
MRIEQLILHTGKLNSLKDFYKIKLGMNVTGETANSFTIQTSSTNIIFNLSTGLQNPFYHFAFNIPENQFMEAKNWAKERVELISLNGEDEFDFKNWNAHSLYFYDPSGNIIELIARHNLKNSSVKKFTGKSLLNVSEIGFPVHDVKKFYDILNDNFNIPSFGGDMKTFT